MKNNKGFFEVEAIASFSIFLIIMLTLIPIVYQIKTEQETLNERRNAYTQLQGRMLEHLYFNESNGSKPLPEDQNSEQYQFSFQFTENNEIVKGCVTWENAKLQEETFCLYGK